ncbi:MAG: shikimate kinase [Candidatus Margulisbacteria bacterium]|jgi:shikimate kinase|nr:shikimate kinase [Candidatus Margulisiibacteriota bacterium]
MNIILIGFMGAGKSAVGQLLARDLGYNYLDTDTLIEQTEKRSVSAIFAAEGEAHFRDLESEVLKTLQDYDGFVLSTGGGMVLRAENISLLKSLGKVILLWADPATLYERVKNETHRPLLKVDDPLAEIKKRLTDREPNYRAAADETINTAGQEPAEIVEEIKQWLKSK